MSQHLTGGSVVNMKQLAILGFAFGLLATAATAKEHPKIRIEVLSAKSAQRQFTYTTPGRAGTSTTNCNSNGSGTINATTYGNNTYGNVNTDTQTNCNTTTTAATPPTAHTSTIQQEYISAVLPNGSHLTLWCQAGFRKCYELQPGFYDAEVTGGSTLEVIVVDLQGKQHRIKYRSVASN